ncbi:MAG: sigma-70 family RNA polymerase sigma factor [Phycisphaerae bacterium]|nr:sigma-70 family RNA polymerase sigma factor [Phycisphaerae bacterium]
MNSSDRQLLLDTHKGHEPSARLLLERLGRGLVAFARSVVRDHQAAEDAVQGALLRLLAARRADVASVTDPMAYLVTLTRREAADQLRALRRDKARQTRHARTRDAPSPSERVGAVDAGAALAALPRRQREVIVLRHIAGLTFEQIALALCLNRNTAAARYRAGMNELRHGYDSSVSTCRMEGCALSEGGVRDLTHGMAVVSAGGVQ